MNRIIWVLFLGLLASGMTQFATAGSTGTIHFYGAIVDGGCTFDTGSKQVTSNCERGVRASNRFTLSTHKTRRHLICRYRLELSPHSLLTTIRIWR